MRYVLRTDFLFSGNVVLSSFFSNLMDQCLYVFSKDDRLIFFKHIMFIFIRNNRQGCQTLVSSDNPRLSYHYLNLLGQTYNYRS